MLFSSSMLPLFLIWMYKKNFYTVGVKIKFPQGSDKKKKKKKQHTNQ